MKQNLVIVESPAKAKTIEKFLGSDYKVLSSYGHIRDLKKKSFSLDPETFDPQYEVPSDKSVVSVTITKDCIENGGDPVFVRDESKLEEEADKPAIAGI